ncbi:MAG TPA: FtsX-like permease family protein [Streptosporangiaceae bacterium]|nr:FtsX-like permease family protein [Streptosporangiaceae bacterium]
MPGLGISFLARRARSSWLLLACVAVTVLLATGLAAALWTFAAAAIPPGAQSILASPQGRVIGLSGVVGGAGQAATDTRQIRAALRKAWPRIGCQMAGALWANPITLSPPRAVRAEASPVRGLPPPVEWQIQVAALAGIRAQTTLTAGKWPGLPHPSSPLPVALPVAVASRLHVTRGSVLKAATRSGPAAARLRVTGLFRLKNPASPYWALDQVPVSGFAANTIPGVGAPGSLVVYGPAVVSPAAFGSGVTARQASWFVLPPASAMARQNIGTLAGSTSQVVTKLTTLILPSGLQVTTRLPQVLDGIASIIVLARSLFAIGALELLLVAAAALVLAARLLASLRDEESALLRARGATRWQLTRPVLAEALVIGAAAGAVGVLAGVRLTGVLASAGQLRLDSYQASRISSLAWLSALAMLALCVAVMAWPALRAGTPDAARIRQGRQARLAGVAWAGGDLAVVALAALAVWQLRGYSAVAHPAAGSLGIDPVVAIAPPLALAGVALVPLRTLPLLARLAEGATERARRLPAAMVSWQIGRRPIRQAGPVLLVVVATATTTLALAGWASWQRSAADQAAFAVGSDVRVDATAGIPLDPRAITGEPGVTATTPASIASIGSGGQLIALGAATAGKAILLRPDLSPVPLSSLWRRIIPRRPAGVALPGLPDRLQILASLGAGPNTSAAALRRELGSATATASVQDVDGVSYQLPAGALPADGQRHALVVPLPGPRQASYPLRLLSVSLTYVLPPYDPASPLAAPTGNLSIFSLAVARTASGPFGRPFSHGAALAAWQAAGSSPHVPTGPAGTFETFPPSDGARPAILSWRGTAGGGQQLTFDTGHDPSVSIMNNELLAPQTITGQVGITAQPPSRIVPAIATSGYLTANRLHTGSTVSVPAGGSSVPVRIVASVARFPTVLGQNRALIADLGAVSDVLAADQGVPLPVTSMWLRTRGGRVPYVPAGLSVADRARQQAALLHNPLLEAPRQAMLAIGAAALLLGVLGLSVSVAASLRTRRTQSAVLAALGVGQRAQAAQLCLEQFALSVPAAAVGLLAGIGLARLVVPAITLSTGATAPVPSALAVLPLGQAITLALVTAALPVAAAALSVARRPDPAAQLRAEAR